MHRILFLALAIVLILSLSSCSQKALLEPEKSKTTEQSASLEVSERETETLPETNKTSYHYPYVANPLTPEKLAALPIASASMSIDQLRQLCLDYFDLQLSFSWTPDASFPYIIESSEKHVTLEKGSVYGGLPYVTHGTGNLYRVLEHYDKKSGVMPISLYKKDPRLYGNQCSVGAFWGWGRVVNSANYTWTATMVRSNGFIPLGSYQYDFDMKNFVGTDENSQTTEQICSENGKDVMYESYAKMKLADGMVTYSGTAGHVRMCSQAPTVVRSADGKIDPDQSYLKYCDQTSKWTEGNQSDGSQINFQGGRNVKVTFRKLYETAYLPFTFAEFLGTDPVEPSFARLDLSGDTVTIEQLKESILNANYAISDVFLKIYDETGVQIYQYVKRSTRASVMEVVMTEMVFPAALSKYTDGKCDLEISCQLSTGEKPTVYTGKLVKE